MDLTVLSLSYHSSEPVFQFLYLSSLHLSTRMTSPVLLHLLSVSLHLSSLPTVVVQRWGHFSSQSQIIWCSLAYFFIICMQISFSLSLSHQMSSDYFHMLAFAFKLLSLLLSWLLSFPYSENVILKWQEVRQVTSSADIWSWGQASN